MIEPNRNPFGRAAARKIGTLIRGVSTTIRRHISGPFFGTDNPAFLISLNLHRDASIDLTHPVMAEILINQLSFLRQEHWVKVAGFVVLPRQFQMVITPADPKLLPDIVRNIASVSSKQINVMLRRGGEVWDGVVEEQAITGPGELRRQLDRMRRQPADKHLIYNASKWPWSSFHRSLQHVRDADFFAAAR